MEKNEIRRFFFCLFTILGIINGFIYRICDYLKDEFLL